MVTLKPSTRDCYNVFIMDKEKEVGRISHDNVIPERLLDVLNDEEVELIKSIEDPKNFMYLSFICIYEPYQGRGYFGKAMKEFEEYTKDFRYQSITLVALNKRLKEMYELLGYETVGYLESVESYLMKKDLD